MRVLVTGGAGFVGASVSVAIAERVPGAEVIAGDNLHRRGSELNLSRLTDHGVRFEHLDVRARGDLDQLGEVDVIVEASAEPSVLAGVDGSVDYLYDTNLTGAFHCLELARRCDAALIFLSSSRVYPVAALRSLALVEEPTRFSLGGEQPVPGASSEGINEDFPMTGARTLYGATKFAAETLIAEYVETFGLRASVLRCGVVTGPWQMGRVDQGVFAYWLLAHHFGIPLRYLGFGGTGKQVRDLLHIDDLVDLVTLVVERPDSFCGRTFGVGGGRRGSLSLCELTARCAELTGRATEVTPAPDDGRPGDIPVFVTDCRRLADHSGWSPTRSPDRTLEDIWRWASPRAEVLRSALFA